MEHSPCAECHGQLDELEHWTPFNVRASQRAILDLKPGFQPGFKLVTVFSHNLVVGEIRSLIVAGSALTSKSHVTYSE